MHIVWLASYPKSGNTWMRTLLANLRARDKPVDINTLGRRYAMASNRSLFEDHTLLDSGSLTEDEIDRMRPGVYHDRAVQLASQRGDPLVMKCHDAYTRLDDGTPLLGFPAAQGAIIVVRDPRDVALSFADHRGTQIDDAIDLMCNPVATIGLSIRGQRAQLRQRLLDWSGHVSSWLDQIDVPVHLVRYEDIEADAVGVLTRTAGFSGFEATADQVARATRLSAFNILRAQEEASGFKEGTRDRPFFRRGHSGAWRTALAPQQVKRIEGAHREMMTRLGYEL